MKEMTLQKIFIHFIHFTLTFCKRGNCAKVFFSRGNRLLFYLVFGFFYRSFQIDYYFYTSTSRRRDCFHFKSTFELLRALKAHSFLSS